MAEAKDNIPTDRIIDGIDQTVLLLKGEHHGRRDYVYIYENEMLRSIVKQEFKIHMPAPLTESPIDGVCTAARA